MALAMMTSKTSNMIFLLIFDLSQFEQKEEPEVSESESDDEESDEEFDYDIISIRSLS